MVSTIIVFAAALVACNANPIWFTGGYVPNVVFREARAPSIAYGFGTGFSANIAGVRHSNAIGASFNTGDGQAYGAGIAGADGNVYANGIGYAQGAPTSYAPSVYGPVRYYNAYPNNYGQASSSAQNYGNYGSYGSALSQAQSQNGAYASVPAHFGRYQNLRRYPSSATSIASGYDATATSSSHGQGSSAVSSARGRDDLGGQNTVIAASENSGEYSASTAQTVQQNGGAVTHTGATSIDGPGIQATHSHAIRTGHYY